MQSPALIIFGNRRRTIQSPFDHNYLILNFASSNFQKNVRITITYDLIQLPTLPKQSNWQQSVSQACKDGRIYIFRFHIPHAMFILTVLLCDIMYCETESKICQFWINELHLSVMVLLLIRLAYSVKPLQLAPRFLAKLVHRHAKVQNEFTSMKKVSVAHHISLLALAMAHQGPNIYSTMYC